MACWCLLFTYDCDLIMPGSVFYMAFSGGSAWHDSDVGIFILALNQSPLVAAMGFGACNPYDCDWSYGPGKTTPGPCLCGGAADGQYFDGVHEGIFFLSLNMPYIHAHWHFGACLRLMIVIGCG